MTARVHMLMSRSRLYAAALAIATVVSFGVAAAGQYSGGTGATASYATSPSSAGIGLTGSVPSGTATNEILHLTLRDAIDRALKYNLGSIEGGENTALHVASDWSPLASCCRRSAREFRKLFSKKAWRRSD